MSDPHSLPNDLPPSAENGFLFSDWELPEKSLSEAAPQFDGKIIARMPDLGSESFAQNTEKSKFPSFGESIGLSIASMIQGNRSPSSLATRQRFLLRFISFGCIILLCGVGILFLEGENKPAGTENVVFTKLISEREKQTVDTKEDSPLTPVLPSGSNGTLTIAEVSSKQTISDAPVESAAVTSPSGADSSGQARSAWNRPVADAYSPWNVAPRQSANPPVTDAAAAENSPPSASPSVTVAMSPMIDMSMPISPYEQQLLAQANAPAQRPVAPFVQSSGYVVPGMMPMQERQENPASVATANTRQSASPQYYNPQYLPPGAVQGMHPQYGQYNPQAVPPNMPIPSGASTLPPQGQGGYYQQPHGAAAVMPAGDYHHAPPTYRRVY